MLAVRNNRAVNVYGGPRSELGMSIQKASTTNINKITKDRARRVVMLLLTSIVLLGLVTHLLRVTTSDDTGVFRNYIISLSKASLSSLNMAIKIAEKMKSVPQSFINVGTGALSSVLGNVTMFRKPRMKKAMMTGVMTGMGMSMIPVRGTALNSLIQLRNTVTPSTTMRRIMKVANSTPGRAVMTWAGLKTSRHYFTELSDMLTRYLLNFAASYGISVVQSVREFKKFKDLPNSLKRASLLTESNRLRIAGGVLNVIQKKAINNRNNNRNAANALLALSRNTR
jgi:hypothetical protein